jgi:Fe-S-cluster containining protein
MPWETLSRVFPEEGWKCKKSCGKCCVDTAPVERSEVEAISDWIVENVTFESLKAQFLDADTRPGMCPFLKADKTCFIYPVRPVVCRAFGHLEILPDSPRYLSQKCPEGVEFTAVKFEKIFHLMLPWYEAAQKGFVFTRDFRHAVIVAKNGETFGGEDKEGEKGL